MQGHIDTLADRARLGEGHTKGAASSLEPGAMGIKSLLESALKLAQEEC